MKLSNCKINLPLQQLGASCKLRARISREFRRKGSVMQLFQDKQRSMRGPSAAVPERNTVIAAAGAVLMKTAPWIHVAFYWSASRSRYRKLLSRERVSQ